MLRTHLQARQPPFGDDAGAVGGSSAFEAASPPRESSPCSFSTTELPSNASSPAIPSLTAARGGWTLTDFPGGEGSEGKERLGSGVDGGVANSEREDAVVVCDKGEPAAPRASVVILWARFGSGSISVWCKKNSEGVRGTEGGVGRAGYQVTGRACRMKNRGDAPACRVGSLFRAIWKQNTFILRLASNNGVFSGFQPRSKPQIKIAHVQTRRMLQRRAPKAYYQRRDDFLFTLPEGQREALALASPLLAQRSAGSLSVDPF